MAAQYSCPPQLPLSPRCWEENAQGNERALALRDISMLSRQVAVYISASPRANRRYKDHSLGDCRDNLLNLLKVTRRMLPFASVVVIFDGPHPTVLRKASMDDVVQIKWQLPARASAGWLRVVRNTSDQTPIAHNRQTFRAGEPGLLHLSATTNESDTLARYLRKISEVSRSPDVSRVVVHGEWLHGGLSLERVMMSSRETRPVVFCLQEDIEIIRRPTLDVAMIVSRLLCDASVERVLLSWDSQHSAVGYSFGQVPLYGKHPDEGTLLRMRYWSDRPHLATRDAYRRRVWPHFTPSTRVLVEHQLNNLGKGIINMTEWGLWLYSPSNCIVDGECVESRPRIESNPAVLCNPQHERHHNCGRYLTSRNKAYG